MPCGRQCAFSSSRWWLSPSSRRHRSAPRRAFRAGSTPRRRSEEHTSELQSQSNLVCRLLLEKKKLRHLRSPRCEGTIMSAAATLRCEAAKRILINDAAYRTSGEAMVLPSAVYPLSLVLSTDQ